MAAAAAGPSTEEIILLMKTFIYKKVNETDRNFGSVFLANLGPLDVLICDILENFKTTADELNMRRDLLTKINNSEMLTEEELVTVADKIFLWAGWNGSGVFTLAFYVYRLVMKAIVMDHDSLFSIIDWMETYLQTRTNTLGELGDWDTFNVFKFTHHHYTISSLLTRALRSG